MTWHSRANAGRLVYYLWKALEEMLPPSSAIFLRVVPPLSLGEIGSEIGSRVCATFYIFRVRVNTGKIRPYDRGNSMH